MAGVHDGPNELARFNLKRCWSSSNASILHHPLDALVRTALFCRDLSSTITSFFSKKKPVIVLGGPRQKLVAVPVYDHESRPEMSGDLGPASSTPDRTVSVARAFHIKLQALMNDLFKKKVFDGQLVSGARVDDRVLEAGICAHPDLAPDDDRQRRPNRFFGVDGNPRPPGAPAASARLGQLVHGARPMWGR